MIAVSWSQSNSTFFFPGFRLVGLLWRPNEDNWGMSSSRPSLISLEHQYMRYLFHIIGLDVVGILWMVSTNHLFRVFDYSEFPTRFSCHYIFFLLSCIKYDRLAGVSLFALLLWLLPSQRHADNAANSKLGNKIDSYEDE